MAEGNAKERLVDLLDREAFQPVLNARADDFQGADRDRLERVQDATRRERDRYRNDYGSAEEVRRQFRSDLSSQPARDVQRDLKALGLPTLPDVEDDFETLSRDLGVE